MTLKQKQAIGAAVLAALTAICAVLVGTDQSGPEDGCIPCDCSGAVVALPGGVTALAADASAVTAVVK